MLDLKILVKEYYSKQIEDILVKLEKKEITTKTSSRDLVEYMHYLDSIQRKSLLSNVPPPESLENHFDTVKEDIISRQQGICAARKKEIDDKIFNLLEGDDDKANSEVKELKAKREALIESRKTKYNKELENLRIVFDRLNTVFNKNSNFIYSIEGVPFDYNKMTLKDISKLTNIVQTSLDKIESFSSHKIAFKVAYLPVELDLGEKLEKPFYIIYFVVFIILMAISYKSVLGILGLILVLNLIREILFNIFNSDIIDLGISLMQDRNIILKLFNQKIEDDEDIKKLTQDIVMKLEFRAQSPEIKEQIDSLEKEKENIQIETDQQIEQIHLISYSTIADDLSEIYDAASEKKAKNKQEIDSEHERIFDLIQKRSDNFQTLGNYINQSFNLVLHVEDNQVMYKEFLVGSDYIEFTSDPMWFNDQDMLKLYIINMLTNVKQKHLVLDLVDPLYQGMHYAEIYSQDLTDYINIITQPTLQYLPSLKSIVEDRIKKLGALSIQEFNELADKTGREPVPYRLVVLISDAKPKETVNNEEFQGFLKISAKYGILVWFSPDFSSYVKGFAKLAQHTNTFKYSIGMTERVKNALVDAIKNGVIQSIPYEDYLGLLKGDNDYWFRDTMKGIPINMGYDSGDLNKAHEILLSDSSVHALMGGETGSGKSNVLFTILVSLVTTVHPKWLSIVFVDFKLATAAMLADDYLAPHFQILAGTKDGDYALSIFQFAVKEMKRRLELFAKYKVSKIAEFNKKVMAGEIDEEIMPRQLLAFDEYQSMFKEADAKVITKVVTLISILASESRATGQHMLFCSQTSANAIPAEVLKQFTARIALRCDADTSTSVLGNPASSTLTGFGWLYENRAKGNPKGNVKVRVPYMPDELVQDFFSMVHKKGHSEGEFRYLTEMFNAETTIDERFLTKQYNLYPKLESNNIVVLGERLDYSDKSEPIVFKLDRKDGANILVTGAIEDQCQMIFKNIMTQLDKKSGKHLNFVCSLDPDFERELGLDNFKIVPKFRTAFDFDDLVDTLIYEINTRKDNQTGSEQPAIFTYIIALHKDPNLAEQSGKIYDKLTYISRVGPSQGIHLICYTREYKAGSWLYKTSSYAITTACDDSTSASVCLGTTVGSKLTKNTAVLVEDKLYMKKFKVIEYPLNKSKSWEDEVFS